MKFAALVVSFVILATAMSDDRRCKKQEDCDSGECCLRDTIFKKGVCKPLAKEDESCTPKEFEFGIFEKYYLLNCPCAEGLACEPTETNDFFGFTVKTNEKCIAGTTEAPTAE